MAFWDDLNNQALQQAQAGHAQTFDSFNRSLAVQRAVADKQMAQKAQGDGGNWLTHLLPSGGSIAGGLGGAALGTALLPGIGTIIGGLLGGAAGGAAGKVGENATEHVQNLGSGVGNEALMGGLTSLPLGTVLKGGQALVKGVTGVGGKSVGELLGQAGEKAVPNFMAKAGAPVAEDVAGQAATQVANPGKMDAVRAAIANKGAQMEARAGGFGIGEKVPGTSPLGFYDSGAIRQNLASEGIKTGTPESRLKSVEDALAQRGSSIDEAVGKNNVPLGTPKRREIVDSYSDVLKNTPGITPSGQEYANSLINDFKTQVHDTKSLIDFRRKLDSNVIAYNRSPDAALADRQVVARALRQTISDHTDQLVPGISDLNKSYSNLTQAKEYLVGGARAVSDQSQGQGGGGLMGRLLTNDTAQGVKSKAGGLMQKAGSTADGPPPLPGAGGGVPPGVGGVSTPEQAIAQVIKGQTLKGAIGRNFVERNLAGGQGAVDQATAGQPDANGLTPQDYANAGIAPTDPNQPPDGSDPNTAPQDPLAGFGVTPQQIQQAMVQAVQSGDTKALANLTSLYTQMQATQKAASSSNGLNSSQQTLANNAVSGLQDLSNIRQALQKDSSVIWKDAVPGGSIARGLTGTTNYEAARQNVVDVISRLRSGAAITADEAKRYESLLPQYGNSVPDALNKLDRLDHLLSSFAKPQAPASNPDLASLLSQYAQ